MIRRLSVLIVAIVVATSAACAQSTLTTFIFVRHAEKVIDGSKDPELTAEGKERAVRLSSMLANQKVNAVYATDFKRTRLTVEPMATNHQLMVTTYESFEEARLKELAARHKGGTIVICGHSNTTPAMINKLIGRDQLKQWEDADYGNFVIVTVSASGETSLTMLRY
jgi:2,3-bisphosphoglycerate-dependent phosphoglycerate mutase